LQGLLKKIKDREELARNIEDIVQVNIGENKTIKTFDTILKQVRLISNFKVPEQKVKTFVLKNHLLKYKTLLYYKIDINSIEPLRKRHLFA